MLDVLTNLVLGYDEHIVPTMTISVVIVGMVVLAVLDVWREIVEDYAIVVLLAVAVVGLDLEGIHPQQWLGAIVVSAIAFMIYLSLGHKGVLGGGDVKLSVVPAFVLGASVPFIGLWWIICALALQKGFAYVSSGGRKVSVAMPHVPAMALATLLASVAFPVAY